MALQVYLSLHGTVVLPFLIVPQFEQVLYAYNYAIKCLLHVTEQLDDT